MATFGHRFGGLFFGTAQHLLDVKDNMLVLAPDNHAAIHATDAAFDWSGLSFAVNGRRLPLVLNEYLTRRP
jgi:hypothetical protein